MSSSDTAISVRGLSKAYTIPHTQEKHTTLAETLLHKARNLGTAFRNSHETFWALKDLDFDIKKGEVIGIIGRNGAGKSTLLKILSRITEPTTGQIDLYGRVGSLLEVGTGFHPELTGRENIFLNGAILGMSKSEIRRQFDAIVDFSGVEQFLDSPVKRYSSGMYVRLAFAVAAHLDPEILIVDEVLAVGDAEFQRKCLGKMRDVASGGRTVLFVSHNLQAISRLCDTAIVLQQGRLLMSSTATDAISHYTSLTLAQSDANFVRCGGTGEIVIDSFEPESAFFKPAERKRFKYRLRSVRPGAGEIWLSVHVRNAEHELLLQCDSRLQNLWLPHEGGIEGTFEITNPWFKPGSYYLEVFVMKPRTIIDQVDQCARFKVSDELPYEYGTSVCGTDKGAVFADFRWDARPVESELETLAV